jgi:hypothetical protein
MREWCTIFFKDNWLVDLLTDGIVLLDPLYYVRCFLEGIIELEIYLITPRVIIAPRIWI